MLRGLIGQGRFAVIQIRRQRDRGVCIGAGNVGTKIGEQSSAHGGGKALANLNDTEAGEQSHSPSLVVTRSALLVYGKRTQSAKGWTMEVTEPRIRLPHCARILSWPLCRVWRITIAKLLWKGEPPDAG